MKSSRRQRESGSTAIEYLLTVAALALAMAFCSNQLEIASSRVLARVFETEVEVELTPIFRGGGTDGTRPPAEERTSGSPGSPVQEPQ